MPRLVITKGPGAGRDYAVGTECVVGRAPDVDFVLEDTLVSRRHVRVFREGDAYVVEDLGSRNGLFAGGKRVPRLRLDDGVAFQVGETVISFRQKSLVEGGSRPTVVAGRAPLPRPVAVPPRIVAAPPAPVPPKVVSSAPVAVAPRPAAAPVPVRPVAPVPVAPAKPIVPVPLAAPPARPVEAEAPAPPAPAPPASSPASAAPSMPLPPPVPGSLDAPSPPAPAAEPPPRGPGGEPPPPGSAPPRRRRLIS